MTRTKEILGTPSYMAPEQAVGETRKLTTPQTSMGLVQCFTNFLLATRLSLEEQLMKPSGSSWIPIRDRRVC